MEARNMRFRLLATLGLLFAVIVLHTQAQAPASP